MDLFLVRHAIAEERTGRTPDSERRLTGRGVRRFQREVRGLEALGITFDRVYHSPFRRTTETADLLKPRVRGDMLATVLLAAPPAPPLLDALTAGDRVAAVGHEPWLSALGAWLVTGSVDDGEHFELKKGAVMWLRGAPVPGAMTLVAHLPPRVLRAVATAAVVQVR